jgi:hypothetical protein
MLQPYVPVKTRRRSQLRSRERRGGNDLDREGQLNAWTDVGVGGRGEQGEAKRVIRRKPVGMSEMDTRTTRGELRGGVRGGHICNWRREAPSFVFWTGIPCGAVNLDALGRSAPTDPVDRR